ncbi:MAG: hypothetical protein ACREEM_12140 [Blastocatellia bacterium]
MQTGILEITGLRLETLKTLAEKAQEVGATAEEYARSLIERGLSLENMRSGDEERQEAIEGIREGLESMRQGKGTPAREFFAELRKEFAIPEQE